ncbi:hypothetical protein OPT61_g4288 [Boeremia exigua]|uniref:Uncharacterized protein n=1 Tax=Boeremia exigua TaxID=749465 RepID=A0ACC2IEK4_9PLEO|nr:hypothetical protein OPT61_g4288 [Boeremia exigua]
MPVTTAAETYNPESTTDDVGVRVSQKAIAGSSTQQKQAPLPVFWNEVRREHDDTEYSSRVPRRSVSFHRVFDQPRSSQLDTVMNYPDDVPIADNVPGLFGTPFGITSGPQVPAFDPVFSLSPFHNAFAIPPKQRSASLEAVVLERLDGSFYCSQLDCDASFLRAGDCRRHLQKHNEPFFACIQRGCDMKFYRHDKLRAHLKHSHGIVMSAYRRGRRRIAPDSVPEAPHPSDDPSQDALKPAGVPIPDILPTEYGSEYSQRAHMQPGVQTSHERLTDALSDTSNSHLHQDSETEKGDLLHSATVEMPFLESEGYKYHLGQIAPDWSQLPQNENFLEPKNNALDKADLDDDISSAVSSGGFSVFSVASLASTATGLSRSSGYSATQVATATRELINIFQEDESFVALYRVALDLPSIGADRLQRNLRRLLKVYADYLKEEAKDQLEFLASRLVLLKARYLAQCIVAKYNVKTNSAVQPQTTDQPDISSGDEEGDASHVDEQVFEDLASFRDFLIHSEAFGKLRSQLKSFISPKEPKMSFLGPQLTTSRRKGPQSIGTGTTERSWQTWFADVRRVMDAVFMGPKDLFLAQSVLWSVTDAIFLTTDTLFIRFGLLEPPLSESATRLRWTSRRGSAIFSDITEHRDDGVARILPYLQRSTGAKVAVTSYNRQAGNQRYIFPHPIRWVKDGFSKLTTSVSQPAKAGPCIPLHNTSSTTTASPTAAPPVPLSTLHLLSCMHHDRSRKVLQQDLLQNVHTDRELFRFMQQQYIQHRGRFRSMLSFKSVQGIFLVRFSLPSGKIVVVREHKPYCTINTTQTKCQCIPPADIVEPSQNAQYRCVPGPPEVYPPIPSEHLLLLFSHPDDANEDDDWILKQLPKRVCGKLQGQRGQPAEGWGVYYQEGWDRDLIFVVIFLVFLIASVVFGVLWSVLKLDVQGAFGVSAYMVAVCALLIPLLVTALDKPH